MLRFGPPHGGYVYEMSSGVARIWCEGGTKLHEFFVAHKMARNNTLNKVHAAANELPQLLSQNTTEATAHSCCQTLCSGKVN